MDLFQSLATVILMSLVIYFIMVNIDGRMHALKTGGDVKDAIQAAVATAVVTPTELPPKMAVPTAAPRTAPRAVSNTLPAKLEEGLNVAFDPHTIDRMEPTVNDGAGPNLTTSAVFNPEAMGVVPSNHDLFERRADFGSDLTNINQFYRNNPEIFHKSMIHVPDVASWNAMSDQMHQSHVMAPTEPVISAYEKK